MLYLGRHDLYKLPIKPGDRVTIPKGALVSHNGELVEVKRPTVVRVHHLLGGEDFYVGTYQKATGECYFWGGTQEPTHIRSVYGESDPQLLWPLMTTVDKGEYVALLLPWSNPKVCWRGTKGQWKSADINQVLLNDK